MRDSILGPQVTAWAQGRCSPTGPPGPHPKRCSETVGSTDKEPRLHGKGTAGRAHLPGKPGVGVPGTPRRQALPANGSVKAAPEPEPPAASLGAGPRATGRAGGDRALGGDPRAPCPEERPGSPIGLKEK